MKFLYWNARGLANSLTRLELKKLIALHKPDIILISEPWMNFEEFPKRWLVILKLKLFAVNNKPNMLPNLWCICKVSLDPVILVIDEQQVSFVLSEDNKHFALSAIYASTNYLTRKQLWNSLNMVQSNHILPWCFIGDFNSILGAHEHRGNFRPARFPMEEFQNWTDCNNLIHLQTGGAEYTWCNGRGENRMIERRLDRAIVNQAWIDTCSSIYV